MNELIGIATWNYTEGTLAERIKLFNSMGYNSVSINAADARALCSGETPEVEEAITKHSMALVVHAGLMNREREFDEESLMADFEWIVGWNSQRKLLRTINYDAASTRAEDGTVIYRAKEMHDVLQKMLELSRGEGFTVGVEDWPRNKEHLEDVSDLQAYPHYGILIDLGHLNMRIRQGLDPDSPFPCDRAQAYLDDITLPVNELHIHNNNGSKDLHSPLSAGNSDLPALAGMLKAKGVHCISTIEIAPGFCGISQETAVAAAREAYEFWSSMICEK